jgi:cell division protein FtsL
MMVDSSRDGQADCAGKVGSASQLIRWRATERRGIMTRDRSESLTMSEETRITADPLLKESRFWKWNRWIWFILFLAFVSINVATFRQKARLRQSLIEIQQNQAKIDELKKEADRLKQELEERK